MDSPAPILALKKYAKELNAQEDSLIPSPYVSQRTPFPIRVSHTKQNRNAKRLSSALESFKAYGSVRQYLRETMPAFLMFYDS